MQRRLSGRNCTSQFTEQLFLRSRTLMALDENQSLCYDSSGKDWNHKQRPTVRQSVSAFVSQGDEREIIVQYDISTLER